MSAINQAFIFIKPHAVDSEYAALYIDMVFKQHGIRTVNSGTISGSVIKTDGLIDRHYAVNAHTGTIKNPAELFVPEAGIKKFQKTFNVSWQDVLADNMIISGQCFQDKTGLSSEELYNRWEENGFTKICPGIYVSYFREENCYVLNGFYPSNRDMFIAEEASIRWSIIEFSPEDLSWFDFRHNVIGVTNPEMSSANSIRGFIWNNRDKAGISVSYKENIIHASASPFEALIEKDNWLQENFDPQSDPLFNMLACTNLKMSELRELYETNPVIQYGDVQDTLVNILEDNDTQKNFEIITSIL